MPKWKELRSYATLVALAYAVMILVNADSSPLQANIKNLVFDQFQRWRPRPYAFDQPVRIVDIDDESLQRIGQWPWPRRKVAELVDALTKAQVAAVGLGILFSEKERPYEESAAGGVFRTAAAEPAAATAPPDGDAILAKAIAGHKVALGSILLGRRVDSGWRPTIGYATNCAASSFGVSYPGVLAPIPALAESADGVGFLNWTPDADRVVRQVPLMATVDGAVHPAFALETIRVALEATTYIAKCVGGGAGAAPPRDVAQIRVGDVTVETQARGGVRAYFAASDPRRFFPAWKIFEAGADLSDLKGKIVLVGATASLLSDVVATPLNPSTSGVEAEAQLIEQILSGVSLRRPEWAGGVELVAAALLSLGFVLIMPIIPAIWSATVGGLAAALLFAASWLAFTRNGLLLDPIIPSLSSGIVFLAGILSLYSQKRGQVLEIRSAFGRYVSPTVVAQLAERPENLRLGGLQRPLTVMFCDLRNFTAISEGFSAIELTSFLNAYLTPMTTAILDQNGTVDKYMGDSIMAFWNAPLDDREHAVHAVRAALNMRATLLAFNRDWVAPKRASGRPYPDLQFGLGLNTGECCVGNLGSHQRFDYSAIGDEVNIASRLEGASKLFGVDIVASATTREAAPEFAWLEIDSVLFKNKTRPISTYVLVGSPHYALSEEFHALSELHEGMLSAYHAREFTQARRFAERASHLAPEAVRGLFGYYLNRFEELWDCDLDEDWRPMIALSEK